jgi:hypothetical protein
LKIAPTEADASRWRGVNPEVELPIAMNAETMSTSKGARLGETQCSRRLPDCTDAKVGIVALCA